MSLDFGQRRWRNLLTAFAAGSALMGASVVNFLHHNDYPLLRPEVGLIFAGLLAASAAMALLYEVKWARPFLEGLMAALFVDFNTDSWPLILTAGCGVAIIVACLRISLLAPMAVLGSVVMVTTIAGVGGSPTWISTGKRDDVRGAAFDKPAIVHIILDEHLGIEGLTPEGGEAQSVRDELRAFYRDRGFALYGGAYSQHYHSANSIPYILNFGRALGRSSQRRGIRTGPTEHLQNLVRQGYRLTVIQSDFADFCTGALVHECITYDSSGLRPTLAAPMSPADRASLILHKFVTLSDITVLSLVAWNKHTATVRGHGWPLPRYHPLLASSSSVGSLETFGELVKRLKNLRPGEAIFAHLLLPHHPYVVRRDCSYLPWPWEGLRTQASREVKLAAYEEQLRCTSRKIDAALHAISDSPAGANVVVIVHGDHGSRISNMGTYDQTSTTYSDADLIQVFSTLFAVRAPGVRPAYDAERQPVSTLLRDFAESEFRSAPHPSPLREHRVYLANSAGKPVRQFSLPASWTHSDKESNVDVAAQ